MCGIYGNTGSISGVLAKQKLSLIDFRGPDFSGITQVNGVTLGHNRLSILDLDKRSNQPFEYRHTIISFNGEIYNYLVLRTDLIQKGYNFTTESDTEVLCALYIEYGKAFLSRLEGMFAFVIYDKNEKILFGARDRFGQKPFYYSNINGTFEFASQVNSLALGNNYSLSDNAISQFLLWKYIPEPLSIYNEVYKLKAGHCFTYLINSNNLNVNPYYTLSKTSSYLDISFDDAVSIVDSVLRDAVRKRLISDVPLGVFLSGGIDSSLITYYASEIKGKGLKTFSIKFNETGFDESIYAEKIAQYFGTNHNTITCHPDEGIDLIENICNYYTEPFSDSSAIPSMLLSKHTKQHVTVALSGDAGDEPFIGYDRYLWMQRLHSIYKLPYGVRKTLLKSLSILPLNKLKLISSGLSRKDLGELYKHNMTSHSGGLLLDPSKGQSTVYDEYLTTDKDWLEKYSDFDLKTYLNGDINTKVDRASMAFSLEVRSPFLDHNVVELAKSLPLEYRYRKGKSKFILKELLSRKLPRKLFERPKSGFSMPLREWFRKDLRDLVNDTLTADRLKNIPNLDVKKSLKYVDQHMSGKEDRYAYIWSLLVLTKWLDQYN